MLLLSLLELHLGVPGICYMCIIFVLVNDDNKINLQKNYRQFISYMLEFLSKSHLSLLCPIRPGIR